MLTLEDARSAATRYLSLADRLLPNRIVGFYLTGSSALGAFVPGRSDIDFVAVLDRGLSAAELRRVRLLQLRSGVRTTLPALRAGHLGLPGTVNGVFVREEDLTLPVTQIRPVVSHVGLELHRGGGFDVNPVVWKELHDGGVTLRGPAPASLGLDPEPAVLRAWNLDNLNRYWKHWADTAVRGRNVHSRPLPTGWLVSWGVLGAPRLHCTIATGEIVSKDAAGEYALDVFEAEWHPIIHDALAFQRLQPSDYAGSRRDRITRAGQFVAEVVRSANGLEV